MHAQSLDFFPTSGPFTVLQQICPSFYFFLSAYHKRGGWTDWMVLATTLCTTFFRRTLYLCFHICYWRIIIYRPLTNDSCWKCWEWNNETCESPLKTKTKICDASLASWESQGSSFPTQYFERIRRLDVGVDSCLLYTIMMVIKVKKCSPLSPLQCLCFAVRVECCLVIVNNTSADRLGKAQQKAIKHCTGVP